jgi:hypothetical protein
MGDSNAFHPFVLISEENKMKYSAILFDLDGVICHPDQYMNHGKLQQTN